MFYPTNHPNRFQRNCYVYSYIGHYIDPNIVPLSNIGIQPYKTRNTNTVFIHYIDLHRFFLDFLKENVYPYSDMSEIPYSYNLLTNIQSVMKLYVTKHSLMYGNKILLDANLNRIIDECLEVIRNRLASKKKEIKFEKEIIDKYTYISYNTLMKVANVCLIDNNTDFFFLKRKYLIYICIKYNIDHYLIKSILDYYC